MSEPNNLRDAEARRVCADIYEYLFFASSNDPEMRKWVELRSEAFILGFKEGWDANPKEPS